MKRLTVQVVYAEPNVAMLFMEKKHVGTIELKKLVEGCKNVKILFAKKIDTSPDYYYFKSNSGTTIGVPEEFLISKIGSLFDPVLDQLEERGGEKCEGIDIAIDRISNEISLETIEKIGKSFSEKENNNEAVSEQEGESETSNAF